ncbi:MAG: hypothetical protein JSV94_06440 [Methanobacteriota archaeon]|nr:MAG: hypothetical protein JSV94_06440 [Euryarchaeota archaeon]
MPGQLSVNDRVLLHLSKYATDTPPEEYAQESTQIGIAEGVGISRTHVPRAVRMLIRDGLVEESRGRVIGRERRMSVYTVTPEGFRKAEAIWDAFRTSSITVVRGGEPEEVAGRVLEDLVGKRRAVSLVSRMRDRTVELVEGRRAPVRDLRHAPEKMEFFGRGSEIEELKEFLQSDARVMVVMGGKGFGATSLVREFVHACESVDVAWLTLGDFADSEQLEAEVVGFASKIAPEIIDLDSAVAQPDILLVFDDYYSVSEDIVELFSRLVDSEDRASKIIIIAREDTPAYSWFYHRRHVQSGVVRELRLKGLGEDDARRLLGNPDIGPEAFRRVYLMSRGQPRLLRLLRDGDTEGLKAASVFTAEEIRYLLFLMNKSA